MAQKAVLRKTEKLLPKYLVWIREVMPNMVVIKSKLNSSAVKFTFS
jgi:hypothetical protein